MAGSCRDEVGSHRCASGPFETLFFKEFLVRMTLNSHSDPGMTFLKTSLGSFQRHRAILFVDGGIELRAGFPCVTFGRDFGFLPGAAYFYPA